MGKKYRRRNYFIKKELQGKIIFSYFLFVVLGVGIFALGFGYMSSDSMSITYENYDLQLGATPRILYKEMLLVFWAYIVFGGAFIVAWAMFFTHRIAGPMYKIEGYFDRMLEGKIGFKIHLRTKDEAKDLVGKINLFNSNLADRVATVKALSEEIQKNAARLDELLLDDQKSGEAGDLLQSIREKNGALQDAMNAFSIEKDA